MEGLFFGWKGPCLYLIRIIINSALIHKVGLPPLFRFRLNGSLFFKAKTLRLTKLVVSIRSLKMWVAHPHWPQCSS